MASRSTRQFVGIPMVLAIGAFAMFLSGNPVSGLLGALIAWYFIFGRGTDAKKEAERWRRGLGHCRYVHTYDGDGIALDPKARQLHLCQRAGNELLTKTYPLSAVREWGWDIGQPHNHGVLVENLRSAVIARRETGFWLRVRDVDHPTWFIHFPLSGNTERELERWAEIMRQAYE